MALLSCQREFCKEPGLVADGRDMGTVVFPEAKFKFFLTASVEVRARRRLKQLSHNGTNGTLETILAEMQARDKRDAERAVAPMQPAIDAIMIDTSNLAFEAVCERVWQFVQVAKS